MTEQGLIIINTGNGKGKTTAALGQALRTAGHGFKVCIIQFIKGAWETGEAKALKAFPDLIEFHVKGSGFTWEEKNLEKVKQAAQEGWKLAQNKIMSNNYDLVILDELTYLIKYQIIKETEVLRLLKKRPGHLHIVITGRNASPGLIKAADLVTEMKEIKHPFSSGIKARKGIEF